MSHTKGNWRTSNDCSQVTVSKVGILEGSKQICIVSDFGKEYKEFAANAKLIAAAPELLEALLILIGDIERSPNKFSSTEKIEIAKNVIKKATE